MGGTSMCGICGYFGICRVGEILKYEDIKRLVLSVEHRGKDSTGIFCSSNDKIYKAPLRPSLFFEFCEQFDEFVNAIENSNALIMHNRLSTSGSPQINRNNQPFLITRFVFSHNGVYWYDYTTLEQNRSIEKISDNSIDNDSYELFKRLFNRNLEINEKTIVKTLEREQSILSFAISIYDSNSNILYLARDDEKPLYYLTDRETALIYCSEDSYLKKLKKKLNKRFNTTFSIYKVKEYSLIKVYTIYNKLYTEKFDIAIDYYSYSYVYKQKKNKSVNKVYYLYDDFEYFTK